MPFRRTNATRRQGTRPGAAPRSRRPNLKRRINAGRSARAQQSQLRSVANMVLRNRSILRAQRQILDFKYVQKLTGGFINDYSKQVIPLMRPVEWIPTMRINTDDVKESRVTYIPKIEFNFFLTTEAVVDRCATTMFLVTLKSSSANWNGLLTDDTDWTNMGPMVAPYLNPNRFKVHWTRHFITFPENEQTTGTVQIPSGNPNTQYRRMRVSLKYGQSIRAPAGESWRKLDITDLSPSKRLYLLAFFNSYNAGATKWELNWALKTVAINSQ